LYDELWDFTSRIYMWELNVRGGVIVGILVEILGGYMFRSYWGNHWKDLGRRNLGKDRIWKCHFEANFG